MHTDTAKLLPIARCACLLAAAVTALAGWPGAATAADDALYTVTSEFVGFVDQTTRAMLSPLERLTKLLNAPDKRAMILEMVDKDELDLNLMALLKTNINTARQGGAEDAALFMEKIYKAAAKFVEGA